MSRKKSTTVEGLPARLIEAFGTEEVAEIVRWLGAEPSRYQTIKNYLTGQRTPTAVALKEISELTGFSIHWLITGQGPKKVENLRYQDAEIEEVRLKAIEDYLIDQFRSLRPSEERGALKAAEQSSEYGGPRKR